MAKEQAKDKRKTVASRSKRQLPHAEDDEKDPEDVPDPDYTASQLVKRRKLTPAKPLVN